MTINTWLWLDRKIPQPGGPPGPGPGRGMILQLQHPASQPLPALTSPGLC